MSANQYGGWSPHDGVFEVSVRHTEKGFLDELRSQLARRSGVNIGEILIGSFQPLYSDEKWYN